MARNIREYVAQKVIDHIENTQKTWIVIMNNKIIERLKTEEEAKKFAMKFAEEIVEEDEKYYDFSKLFRFNINHLYYEIQVTTAGKFVNSYTLTWQKVPRIKLQ
jgi:hypothetical protein